MGSDGRECPPSFPSLRSQSAPPRGCVGGYQTVSRLQGRSLILRSLPVPALRLVWSFPPRATGRGTARVERESQSQCAWQCLNESEHNEGSAEVWKTGIAERQDSSASCPLQREVQDAPACHPFGAFPVGGICYVKFNRSLTQIPDTDPEQAGHGCIPLITGGGLSAVWCDCTRPTVTYCALSRCTYQ